MDDFKFQDGDIVLVHVNKFSTWYRWLFAKLICFIDGVYYHHAQIYFKGYLYEADTKVRQILDSHNEGDEVMVLRLNEPLNFKEGLSLTIQINNSLNKDYDYWGALFHQLVYILFFRRIWIGRTGNEADRKLYCSEFVTSLMYHIRGYFPEHYKISPSRLEQLAPFYYTVVFEGKVLI